MVRNIIRSQTGFTFLEIIVTITIITIGILAIATISINIGSINRQSRNLAIATALVQQKMESVRNLPLATIPASEDFTSSLPPHLGSPRTATTSLADFPFPTPGLKRFSVKIYYTDQGVQRYAQVTTVIYERGINR